MSAPFLRQLRERELDVVRAQFPPGARVLEVGAGAGWQAAQLNASGFEVSAIDLAGSEYQPLSVWPVMSYDGHRIPFDDGAFDVVFSSNVLEHIPHEWAFQNELRRVLAPTGIAVHVLPSGTWRVWTDLTYYFHQAGRLFGRRSDRIVDEGSSSKVPATRRSLMSALLPTRHGEEGNCLSEIYLFSRFRWRRLFRSTGWRIVHEIPTGLFYTGYSVLGDSLGLSLRERLSWWLGSACRVFVLARTR